eukprot:6207835-Pleurochrysis_carterae.AAC.4
MGKAVCCRRDWLSGRARALCSGGWVQEHSTAALSSVVHECGCGVLDGGTGGVPSLRWAPQFRSRLWAPKLTKQIRNHLGGGRLFNYYMSSPYVKDVRYEICQTRSLPAYVSSRFVSMSIKHKYDKYLYVAILHASSKQDPNGAKRRKEQALGVHKGLWWLYSVIYEHRHSGR